MTNSTPKMNDKVERQGSPNGGGKRHHRSNGSIRSSTYFPTGSNSGGRRNNGGGRLSCSPPCLAKTRGSPLKQHDSSPRGSPTSSFYAGAKFSEPPSPASLPKPPSHWTTRLMMTTCGQQSDRCRDISNHLKMILNVQA